MIDLNTNFQLNNNEAIIGCANSIVASNILPNPIYGIEDSSNIFTSLNNNGGTIASSFNDFLSYGFPLSSEPISTYSGSANVFISPNNNGGTLASSFTNIDLVGLAEPIESKSFLDKTGTSYLNPINLLSETFSYASNYMFILKVFSVSIFIAVTVLKSFSITINWNQKFSLFPNSFNLQFKNISFNSNQKEGENDFIPVPIPLLLKKDKCSKKNKKSIKYSYDNRKYYNYINIASGSAQLNQN